MIYQDALLREVDVRSTRRVVSLVPSLTELLHDLGMERDVVGITRYCVHPAHYRLEKTMVGGTKKVKYDVIERLKPDFILCSKEENTREMVERLEKIAPVYVTDVHNYDSAIGLIEDLGEITNHRTQAQKIIAKIEYERNLTREFLKEYPVLRALYFIWANPYMAAGSDTFISAMMQEAKLENALDQDIRYPDINIKKIRILYPADVFLFSSEPYDFKDEDVYEVMRYNRKTVAVFVDGQYFSWYGSRMMKSFAYFRELRRKI